MATAGTNEGSVDTVGKMFWKGRAGMALPSLFISFGNQQTQEQSVFVDK